MENIVFWVKNYHIVYLAENHLTWKDKQVFVDRFQSSNQEVVPNFHAWLLKEDLPVKRKRNCIQQEKHNFGVDIHLWNKLLKPCVRIKVGSLLGILHFSYCHFFQVYTKWISLQKEWCLLKEGWSTRNYEKPTTRKLIISI